MRVAMSGMEVERVFQWLSRIEFQGSFKGRGAGDDLSFKLPFPSLVALIMLSMLCTFMLRPWSRQREPAMAGDLEVKPYLLRRSSLP